MTKVFDHPDNPVFVEDDEVRPRHIILRIGAPKRGESRVVSLDTSHARIVAYALLSAAEQEDARLYEMNQEVLRMNAENTRIQEERAEP